MGAVAAVPGSISGKLGILTAVMKDLAATDYTEVPLDVQAEVLRVMHQVDAGQAAVFGRAGSAFTWGHGYDAYAQKNLGRWHITQARVTRAAGFAARAWVRRCERHPQIAAALAEQDVLSESWARQLAAWSDKLPEEHQPTADEILVTAARAGADLEGLARIAAELAALLMPPDEDKDRGPGRGLRLETTFEGAGVLTGDLTPGCAAMVDAVLGALSQYEGKDDLRTPAERLHDALEEAMRRLLAARLLPQRAGAPLTGLVHMSLADLLAIDPGSVLSQRWVTCLHARWKAEQAAASVQPGDHGAWLHGQAATAAAEDAMIVPVVTGTVDISILDHLVDTCLAYGHLRDQHPSPDQDTGPGQHPGPDQDTGPDQDADTYDPDGSAAQRTGRPGQEPAGQPAGPDHGHAGRGAGREAGSGRDLDAGSDGPAAPGQDVPDRQAGRYAGTGPETGTGSPAGADTDRDHPGPARVHDPAAAEADRAAELGRLQELDRLRELARLEKLIIGDAVALMSGSGGLASFLRRNLLGKGLDGPSLPLDVGDTDRIPPQIRRAVTLRDRHCAFPGGCDRPAWDCEPHHCDPRVEHGPSSITNLATLCYYHHHVVVHERGWTVQVEPDGTITARKPDGTLFDGHPTIFSNGPPPWPG